MPQGAVTGVPGQTGQASPAAPSQTVNTKSIAAAPGATNSSKDFERRPCVSKPCSASSRSAQGCTARFGKLPAL
jgi:hypothetical protein